MNVTKKESNVVYIYNVFQCNFYLSKGCRLLETGLHPSTKKTWYKFDYYDTQNAYDEWCKRKNELIK